MKTKNSIKVNSIIGDVIIEGFCIKTYIRSIKLIAAYFLLVS